MVENAHLGLAGKYFWASIIVCTKTDFHVLLYTTLYNIIGVFIQHYRGLVLGEGEDAHPCAALVKSIRTLLSRAWNIRITHVRREGNRLADWLADYSHSLPLGLHKLERPPAGCGEILMHDIIGVGFPRRILV